MYTAVNGIYEDGQLTLTERPPTTRRTKVVILFLDESAPDNVSVGLSTGVRLGSLEGRYSIPDNFNAPLDDLNDYM
ncbi:hypothetical protein [Spirosoma foliorum]|uniref:DUF2281 domain-containing protein n=1 Tax=Spirosoma foliorum TaxID=2710596 RepID=A0A7G5H1U0_9BACT|nr:hypothetical protein [Spirosoma foliorum]QMW05082.1 hypothetical protein H3H32_09430 [Spirosoma foliorum]